jgi:hypothetical protein
MMLVANMELTDQQIGVIESDLDATVFLSGPAGCGKTTSGVQRLIYLAQRGIPGKDILLFFPQRTLSTVYARAIGEIDFPSSSQPTLATLGGLSRRTIELFWPSIIEELSFFPHPNPPVFLTLESSIYFLSRIVSPLILDEGLFAPVTIQRNRLYSQILDNLNKAAVHGFPPDEISRRLSSAWIGEPAQITIFEDAGRAAILFREFCLENNLLDYSLQIELFSRMLSDIPLVKEYLHTRFRHLIYDNVEEDVPASHDFIRGLFASLESAFLIYDDDAGYRVFLGASPTDGYSLLECCHDRIAFRYSFTSSPALEQFNRSFITALDDVNEAPVESTQGGFDAVALAYHPYLPQMADWVAERIRELISSGTPEDQIVVLAPFLSDSMRFVFSSALESRDIPYRTHRPSRALREEPAVHCLLLLAALAHPSWKVYPTVHELASTLVQAIEGLDLTRAHLLSKAVLSGSAPNGFLWEFESVNPAARERITYSVGSRYHHLHQWLSSYRQFPPLPLDHFLIRIFGEILSQPGFGFHLNYYAAETASRVIDSVAKFRLSAGRVLALNNLELGFDYYQLVKSGVLGNQYLHSWTDQPENTVFLAPAYTFLLGNFPVDYQFWLDVGSRGWYERIYQPLTNPYILHRNWNPGDPWRDVEELQLNKSNLVNITTGLLRRCRKGVFCCLSETDERGFEQDGLMVQDKYRSWKCPWPLSSRPVLPSSRSSGTARAPWAYRPFQEAEKPGPYPCLPPISSRMAWSPSARKYWSLPW